MSDFRFRKNYWEDAEARRAFQAFLIDIHGLDLTQWKEAGFWDHECYHPFSFFDESGKVVSSLCIYSLDLIVEGRPCRAAQFSGVGTSPELRRRGLNRRLTELALEWIERDHDLVFLFSAPEALPFYESCGFRLVEESQPFVQVTGCDPLPGLKRLDVGKTADLSSIADAAFGRVPVSHRLGALSPRLFLYHALYTMNDYIYSLPGLDVIVLMKHQGQRLTLFDIVAKAMPDLDTLLPYLTSPETTEVAFEFDPDLLAPTDLQWRPLPETLLHDRGNLPLRGSSFLLPSTAHA